VTKAHLTIHRAERNAASRDASTSENARKRAHRFFHMDPEDCSTRRVGPTPTRSSRNNAASGALQVRLGFVEVYRYWYRLQS